MKKTFTLFILLSLSFFTQAQTKVGFRLAPTWSITKVSEAGGSEATNGQPTLRPSFGLTVDVDLNTRIRFATGLWYSGKIARIIFDTHDSTQLLQGDGHAYALSYLQLPLTVKIYLLTVSKAGKLYVQIGSTIDYKIAEKALHKDHNYFYQLDQLQYQHTRQEPRPLYARWDLGAYLGVGIEWKIGSKHSMITGLAYNRGLEDQMSARKRIAAVHLRSLTFEVGMMF